MSITFAAHAPSETATVSQRARGRRRLPLTRLGWLVLAIAAAAWATGALLGWLELTTLAALGLVLVLFAVPFIVGRTSVHCELQMSTLRVVAGQTAAGQLVVTNTGRGRLLPFELQLPVGEAVARFSVPSLAPGGSHDELLIIPTQRRGIVAVGPASAVRGDPLGLLRRSVAAGERHQLYVHPRTVRLGSLGHGLLRDLEGMESDALSHSDVAFHALREYEPGDDRRHIHWRSSARANTLLVRQFADTRRSHVMLLLSTDEREYATGEEFEAAVSTVGSIGLQALREEQRLEVFAGGARLPARGGQLLMDGLSGVQSGRRGGFAGNAPLLPVDRASASVLVLVTGSRLAPARLRSAARQATSGAVLAVRMDAAEASGFRVVGGVPTVSVADLGELRRLLRAVS